MSYVTNALRASPRVGHPSTEGEVEGYHQETESGQEFSRPRNLLATENRAAAIKASIRQSYPRRIILKVMSWEVRMSESDTSIMQNDLADLRVLGMGDHARPESPHQVMLRVIAEVRLLRARVEVLERERGW